MKQTRRTKRGIGGVSCNSCCDIARASIQEGEVEEALWHLRQAIEIDGDNVAAWQLLGHCFEVLGEPMRARRCYSLALRLSSSSSPSAERRLKNLDDVGEPGELLPVVRPPRGSEDV